MYPGRAPAPGRLIVSVQPPGDGGLQDCPQTPSFAILFKGTIGICMGRMKMCSLANTISLEYLESRGLRAGPPEGGAGGTKAARQAGEGGWMEMRAAQQPDDYPSRGVSSQGTGRRDNRLGCLSARRPHSTVSYHSNREYSIDVCDDNCMEGMPWYLKYA